MIVKCMTEISPLRKVHVNVTSGNTFASYKIILTIVLPVVNLFFTCLGLQTRTRLMIVVYVCAQRTRDSDCGKM